MKANNSELYWLEVTLITCSTFSQSILYFKRISIPDVLFLMNKLKDHLHQQLTPMSVLSHGKTKPTTKLNFQIPSAKKQAKS